MGDNEDIREIAEYIEEHLKLGHEASHLFSVAANNIFDAAEAMADLSDYESATNVENIRKTLIGMFVGWTYGIDLGSDYEKLVNYTYTYLEFIKSKFLKKDIISFGDMEDLGDI
ncbi:MAG: hypothetical protein II393_02230 [Cytophagales bacterium]|nr:hypothetical protein [Cytophagales bacterium]